MTLLVYLDRNVFADIRKLRRSLTAVGFSDSGPAWLMRLCRLMCGKALPYRLGRLNDLGLRPARGVAPISFHNASRKVRDVRDLPHIGRHSRDGAPITKRVSGSYQLSRRLHRARLSKLARTPKLSAERQAPGAVACEPRRYSPEAPAPPGPERVRAVGSVLLS